MRSISLYRMTCVVMGMAWMCDNNKDSDLFWVTNAFMWGSSIPYVQRILRWYWLLCGVDWMWKRTRGELWSDRKWQKKPSSGIDKLLNSPVHPSTIPISLFIQSYYPTSSPSHPYLLFNHRKGSIYTFSPPSSSSLRKDPLNPPIPLSTLYPINPIQLSSCSPFEASIRSMFLGYPK